MGRGIIKSGGDDGLYNVELTLHRERIDDTIAIIDAQIAKLDAKISEMETEILILEMVIWAMPEGNEKEKKKKELKVLVDKKDLEKLRRASYQKRKDYLQDNMPEDPTVSAWCGDLTEDLSGNVGTIEIPGERGIVQIQPGHESNAAYNTERDGQLQPAIANTPAGTFYNLAMLPGWQKWKPTYRHGIISNIDTDNDTCDVSLDVVESSQQGLTINQESKLVGIPIEYMSCNASAFENGDSVLVKFEGQEWNGAKVIGFKDNPKACLETVYVVMEINSTRWCFVWDIKNNAYADIKKNDGNPAVFPCERSLISDWVDTQESVGDSLLNVDGCGVDRWPHGLSCPGGGSGEGNGSSSDSIVELSDCDCGFTDTGECQRIWTTMQCVWEPIPEYWELAGSIENEYAWHILWGKDIGIHHYGSRKISFKNNCDIKTAFKMEELLISTAKDWWKDGIECSGPVCDNITTEGSTETIYKFIPPIGGEAILELTQNFAGTGDFCANTGVEDGTNILIKDGISAPLPMQLKVYGAYSKKTIAQAYFVEAQTVTRHKNCSITGGMCVGSGCIGDECPWQDEEYTLLELGVAAQVGTFKGESYPDGTEGVDPTQLPRNELFEAAIKELYEVLRDEESIPNNEIAGARLCQFWILKS